jgi:DNA-binding transcriptional MerR regulator
MGCGVDEEARWRIEELAERAGVSVYTLRFYQRQRLLPSGEQNGKAKWYGPEHLARLQRIRDLQQQGFSLAAIRVVLHESTAAHVWGLFTAANEERLSRAELIERTGATGELVDGLVAIHALGDPRRSADADRSFDAADVRLLEDVRTLNEAGLPDAVVLDTVRIAVDHLDALGYETQELLFGDRGNWSAEEQEAFGAHLAENIEHVRDAMAWMVRLLQLRSAQRLALASADEADAHPDRRRRTRASGPRGAASRGR